MRVSKQTWIGRNPEKMRFYLSRYGAKRDGRAFELTYEEYVQIVQQRCHYCGASGKVGIDRKDNLKGYVFGNCLPACLRCNAQKGTRSYQDYLLWRADPKAGNAKRMNVVIPSEDFEWVCRTAKTMGRSKSSLVVEALRRMRLGGRGQGEQF